MLMFVPATPHDAPGVQKFYNPYESQTKVNLNLGIIHRNQSLVYKDLNKDQELYKKFTKVKKRHLFQNLNTNMQNWFIRSLVKNKLSKLNRLERQIFNFTLVTLICADWVSFPGL